MNVEHLLNGLRLIVSILHLRFQICFLLLAHVPHLVPLRLVTPMGTRNVKRPPRGEMGCRSTPWISCGHGWTSIARWVSDPQKHTLRTKALEKHTLHALITAPPSKLSSYLKGRGTNYFWNLVYKCPEIRPKISEIQPKIPEIPKISVVREILTKNLWNPAWKPWNLM